MMGAQGDLMWRPIQSISVLIFRFSGIASLMKWSLWVHFQLFPGYWGSIWKFQVCFPMADSVHSCGDLKVIDYDELNEGV